MNLLADFTLAGIPDASSRILWGAAAVGALGFLTWTYRGIRRRSGRRLAWGMLALRIAGLLGLLTILARPTLEREERRTEVGAVAVIVDTSLSMSLPDATGRSRFDRARETIAELRRLCAGRPDLARAEVRLFDLDGKPLAENRLPDRPTAERTDLGNAVRQTLRAVRDRPLAGVVLVSDGADTTGRSDFSDLADLAQPIHTLGFAPTADNDRLDLAVEKPQAPARPLVNTEVVVTVPVRKSGTVAASAVVELRRGAEVVASERITLTDQETRREVALRFTPRSVGEFVFTAVIEGTVPDAPLTNNRVQFEMAILADPIRVLYIEGFLRFESRYLTELLREDPDLALMTIVRRGSPDRPTERGPRETLSAEMLKNFDLVILGDMDSTFLQPPEIDALTAWLDGKNRALLVLGGYASFGPEGWRQVPKLAALLPIRFAEREPFQDETPFVLRLTDEGRRHPIFTLTNDTTVDAETWQRDGRLRGIPLVAGLKPLAKVLVEHPTLTADGKPLPVLVWQEAGQGRTMVLTADSTWEWSRFARQINRPDTMYRRFWSQTIRWLTNRTKEEQRPLLSVAADTAITSPGRTVRLLAKKQSRPDYDLSAGNVLVQVREPNGKLTPISVAASSGRPEEYVGSFVPAQAGRYEVLGELRIESATTATAVGEFLVAGADWELSDPRTNPDTLDAIARQTGGQARLLEEVGSIVGQLQPKERYTRRVERREYWNSPFLFGFFVLMLSLEWYLRKRNRMV